MREVPTSYTMSKWEAMREALGSAMADVAGVVAFGIELFPGSASDTPIPLDCGTTGRCCEMSESADLNAFAEAGGAPVAGGATSYYRVAAEGGVAELTATLSQITSQITSGCRVPIDVDPTLVDLSEVNVAVDCEAVRYSPVTPTDTSVGWWTFDDVSAPTEVIIAGPTCDSIGIGVERIDILFGCPTLTSE